MVDKTVTLNPAVWSTESGYNMPLLLISTIYSSAASIVWDDDTRTGEASFFEVQQIGIEWKIRNEVENDYYGGSIYCDILPIEEGVRFMKRLVTLILAFIICVTFLIIPTSAETYDPYDSRYITSEEKAQLAIPNGGVTYDEEIIKLYYGMFLYSFAQQKDIMSIIETKLQLYMIVTDSVYINVMRIYVGSASYIAEGHKIKLGDYYEKGICHTLSTRLTVLFT